MIITRNWIEEYLNLTDISNQQLAIAFNALGFEVDAQIDYHQFTNNKIVLGYIESVEIIPDTKLKKAITRIGEHKTITVLSTANNIYADHYVIVALPGAQLFNGVELANRQIMGMMSEGMFCAYNEIAFPNHLLTPQEQADIVFVHSTFRDLHNFLGHPINSIIGLDDYAFDLDLTLNRSDALAAYQLIKELANYFKLEIHKQHSDVKFHKNTQKYHVQINKRLDDKINTIAYSLIHLTDKSFELNTKDAIWLKMCKALGSDNKYEDLANMATLVSGQPLILLDADKVGNDFELTMRKFDDKEYCVLKCDNKIVNTLGLKTEPSFCVDSKTQRVLVIMLNVNQILMRQQLKHLNQSTVDLQRYAKPLNPNLYEQGLEAFLLNLKKYDLVDFAEYIDVIWQTKKYTNHFTITQQRIDQILGMSLSHDTIIDLFKTLDIIVTFKKDEYLFEIDLNRTDIYGEYDLCEEIARIYGYDNLLESPLQLNLFQKQQNLSQKLLTKTTDYLIGNGFNNIKTYSLTEKQANEAWNLFNIKHLINVKSPLSLQRESYRTNLSKSMIDTMIFNAKNGNKHLKLFEIGDIFALNEFRQRHLCVGISGVIVHDPLLKINLKAHYLYLQALLSSVVKLYNLDPQLLVFKNKSHIHADIHPFINAEIKYKHKSLGYIYKLNPSFEKTQKLSESFLLEINLDILDQLKNPNYTVNEIAKFQKSTRDVSIELSNKHIYRDIIQKALSHVKYLTHYEIGDIYINDALKQADKYALTIKFEFNCLDKQLTETEINEQYQLICQHLTHQGVVIR